jgi:hypothetical protein
MVNPIIQKKPGEVSPSLPEQSGKKPFKLEALNRQARLV